ncbi:MAG: hypothetical protein AAF919_12555 [Pseudomonadota bacterium]
MSVPGDLSPRRRPPWQRALLIVSALGFVLGIVLSIRARPELVSDLSYGPLVALALVAIPITVLLNAEEFRLSARLLGQEVPRIAAAEVTIVASVANMLPIPGGTMVRVAALKAGGARVRDGTIATLLIAAFWIGVALLYAGAWLAASAASPVADLGIGCSIVGGVVLASAMLIGHRMFGKDEVLLGLVLVKCGLVLVDATRIYLSMLALNANGTFIQASVLSVSSVAGATVSIVPAGLGIREATAALLAPLVALPAASAFLATGLNRLVGLAIMAPVATALGLRKRT